MSRHGLTWLAIFIVLAIMFLRLPLMVAKQDAVVNTYSALVEVDALARQKFVEPITSDRLVQGAAVRPKVGTGMRRWGELVLPPPPVRAEVTPELRPAPHHE